MIKYKFNNFDGFFYIEEPRKQEEFGRCIIYDENEHFLDYVECYYTILDFELTDSYKNYNKMIDRLRNAKDEFDVFEMFCQSYDYGITPQEILKNYCDDIGVEEYDDEKIESILKNCDILTTEELCYEYDMNKIGKYYFRGNWQNGL